MKRILTAFVTALALVAQPASATDRPPLVIASGAIKQLPAGDRIAADITGNASTATTATTATTASSATTLATPRTIAISGKGTGTATSFNGSANITIPITAVTLAAGDIPNIAESQVTNLTTDLAGKQAAAANLTTYAGIAPSANVQTLLGAASFSAFRTSLGLAIGTDVQAYNANLAGLAALSLSQGDILYRDGTGLQRLAAGSAGQVLKSGGSGANPSWISAPYVVCQSGTAVSHTGDTAEFTLATCTINAGTMGPSGRVEVDTLWTTTSSANNKSQRVKFGGTQFTGAVITTVVSSRCSTLIQNRTASSQIGNNAACQASGTSSLPNLTGAIDTTSSVSLTITGQLALGTETITLEAYSVKVTYGP